MDWCWSIEIDEHRFGLHWTRRGSESVPGSVVTPKILITLLLFVVVICIIVVYIVWFYCHPHMLQESALWSVQLRTAFIKFCDFVPEMVLLVSESDKSWHLWLWLKYFVKYVFYLNVTFYLSIEWLQEPWKFIEREFIRPNLHGF